MGRRLLERWLRQPLTDMVRISSSSTPSSQSGHSIKIGCQPRHPNPRTLPVSCLCRQPPASQQWTLYFCCSRSESIATLSALHWGCHRDLLFVAHTHLSFRPSRGVTLYAHAISCSFHREKTISMRSLNKWREEKRKNCHCCFVSSVVLFV